MIKFGFDNFGQFVYVGAQLISWGTYTQACRIREGFGSVLYVSLDTEVGFRAT